MPMFGLPASPCPDMAGAQGRGRVSGRGYFVRDRRATIVEIQMVIRTIVDRSSQYSAYIQRTVAALAMAWRRALNCERSGEHSFYEAQTMEEIYRMAPTDGLAWAWR